LDFVSIYATKLEFATHKFLELAEELNLRILEIVSQAGTSLFMPASSLIIEQSGAAGEDIGAPT
jgi:hypothetical protein